jgi:hypothetical protein
MPKDARTAYEDAAQAYVTHFRALREAPSVPPGVVTRAPVDIPDDILLQEAEQIAEVSATMVPLAREVLDDPDPNLREGMGSQLLAQAAAELQLATELLQFDEGAEKALPDPEVGVVRSARGAGLRRSIADLEDVMAMDLGMGLKSEVVVRGAPAAPKSIPEAKAKLQESAILSTGAIVMHVCDLGEGIAMDLLFKTDWTLVKQGLGMIRGDIAEMLEALTDGIGDLIARAVKTAAKTLINVYDKILAFLGKDVEDQARQKVKELLEKIKEKGEIDILESLVKTLYRVNAFKEGLAGWMDQTTAGEDQLTKTAGEVDLVSKRFIVLVGRMKVLETAIALARKFIKLPQVAPVLAGLQIALLAVLVYGGFDYVGYKQPGFLNLTKGVAEVIQENLLT